MVANGPSSAKFAPLAQVSSYATGRNEVRWHLGIKQVWRPMFGNSGLSGENILY